MSASPVSRPDTLPGLLRMLAREHGEREAVVAPEGRVSYAELLARCTEMARMYRDAGLARGAAVGVLLPNGLRWLISALGAQLAGLVPVPINTWYRSSEYAHVIEAASLRMIVTEETLFGRPVLEDLTSLISFAPLLWPRTSPKPTPAPISLGQGALPSVSAQDLAFVLFTSGSTAVPKMVGLRHGDLVRNSYQIGARQHLVAGDRMWIASPFFFAYGCANALPVALNHAVTLCLQERPDGDAALEFIERERATVYYGLGPTTHTLLDAPSFGRHDISSLRTGTTGMSVEDKRLAIEKLGITEVCSMYGLTEAYGHSTVTDAHDPVELKLHTSGPVLPTQDIRIVNEQGEPCATGEPGEVELRGCVINAYLNPPEINADSFRPGGWLRTGDLAFLDEQRYLHFVGRRKEMMKIKGINIAPAEVEDILSGHECVQQVHVVGASRPDGEHIVAFVVPTPGTDEHTLPAVLTAHIRANAASYKVPGRFVTLAASDVPLTATGKVSKLKLRALAESSPS